jgi:hypothetical protein
MDSNHRPRAYESPALPLSYVAVVTMSIKLHSTQEALSYQGHAVKCLISQLFIRHHPHHGP